MKSWFRIWGYPDNLVKKEMDKVCFSKSTRSKSKSQESKAIPLGIAFHPKFKLIGQLLNSTCTYSIWIKILKTSLHLHPWLHVNIARFILMCRKHVLPAQWLTKYIKLTISLNVTRNV